MVRTAKRKKQKHLQDILWAESLQAVRISTECSSVEELMHRLWSELPQNSFNTRCRHTSVILSRFFPGRNIEQFPRQVLMAYQDDELLECIMGPLLLLVEPVVGRLFAERLLPLASGTELPKDFFTR